MEILVASILFSMVIVGMLSAFVSGHKQVVHVRERMVSSQLGKLFLDPLQSDVRQDTWSSAVTANGLAVGTSYCDGVGGHTQNHVCPSTAAQRVINNRTFTATYVTADVGSGTTLRRVTTTITWNEPPS